MNWNELKRDLSKGLLANAYTFSGKESFLKEKALQSIRDILLPSGFEALNDTTLEEPSVHQIIEAAETFPLMCDKRLLTIVNWKPAIEGSSEAVQKEVEALDSWLKSPPETCVLVFLMKKEPDGRRKATAMLKAHTTYVEFSGLTGADLNEIAAERLQPLGKTIDRGTLEYLSTLLNQDLNSILSELDKLSAYIGQRKRIERKDIDAITSPSLEYSIFRVVDLILKHDLSGAQKMVNSLIANGESHASILAVLSYQYRNLLHMRLQLDAGTPVDQIRDMLKLSPGVARVNAATCKRADVQRLQQGFRACVETDAGIKRGQLNERRGLDILLIRLSA